MRLPQIIKYYLYNQVYVFDVSGETLRRWASKMEHCLEKVNYHYTEKKYELPYEFLNNKIIL